MEILKDILSMCISGVWDEAKLKWLVSFGNMTKSNHMTCMNAYKTEGDRELHSLMRTSLAKLDAVQTWICSNPKCPGKRVETSVT